MTEYLHKPLKGVVLATAVPGKWFSVTLCIQGRGTEAGPSVSGQKPLVAVWFLIRVTASGSWSQHFK